MHLKSVSIYFFFNIINAILPIVTLPFFTRYLTPDDFGTLTVFNIACMITAVLFRMEINTVLKRQSVESKESLTRYLSTAFVFSNFLLLTGALLIGVASFVIPSWNKGLTLWASMVLMISYSRFHTVNLHHLFQINNRAFVYGLWGLLVTLGSFGGAFILLSVTSLKWEARAWADLLVAAIALIPAVYFLRKEYALSWKFDWNTLKDTLRFSLPLLPGSFISYLFMVSDRLFLAELVGPKELGLYSVAIQLSSAVTLILGALLPPWESWLFNLKGGITAGNIDKILTRFLLVLAAMVLVMFGLPKILEWVLPFITSKDFSNARLYLLPTIASATAAGLFALLLPILTYLRRTTIIAAVHVVMLLINFGVLYPYIKWWGTAGAAYAVVTSYVVGGVGLILFMRKSVR